VSQDERRGLLASASAVVAAIGASSCCILPLVLGSLGGSAVALAGTLASLRPYFLGVAALLVFAAWYAIHRRSPATSCDTATSRLQRFVRPVLLASTVAVIGVASFPTYAPVLANGGARPHPSSTSEGSRQLVLYVEGMTCEACAVEIRHALEGVPGVVDAGVDYAAGEAWVVVTADAQTMEVELTSAVGRAGYKARFGNGR
jgi:copper chaperone CopZ